VLGFIATTDGNAYGDDLLAANLMIPVGRTSAGPQARSTRSANPLPVAQAWAIRSAFRVMAFPQAETPLIVHARRRGSNLWLIARKTELSSPVRRHCGRDHRASKRVLRPAPAVHHHPAKPRARCALRVVILPELKVQENATKPQDRQDHDNGIRNE